MLSSSLAANAFIDCLSTHQNHSLVYHIGTKTEKNEKRQKNKKLISTGSQIES